MACKGCTARRNALARWWRRLFAPRSQRPPGVDRALELANELKEHCWAHGYGGTFAGVIVPSPPEGENDGN